MRKFFVGFIVGSGLLSVVAFLVFISAKPEKVDKTKKPNLNMCCFFLYPTWKPAWNCKLQEVAFEEVKLSLGDLCSGEITGIYFSDNSEAFFEFNDEKFLLTVFR